MIEVIDLVKRYSKKGKEVVALGGVTLRISRGEIFALLGPNGAGKTTLIETICGLARKTSGTVRVFNIDLDEDPLGPRYSIGFMPQEVNFDPLLTVGETLRIQQGYYGLRRDDARITEIVNALSLTEKRDALTKTLSGGMIRRLLIAKALIHRPKLVFLDEPTAAVDVELKRDLLAYLRKVRDDGTTVVLTTHNLAEAEEIADRVGIISRGKLLLIEDKVSLLQRMGERRLHLSLDQPLAGLPRTPYALELSKDGCRITYVARQGDAPMGTVLQTLMSHDLKIKEVETQATRLEDVLMEVLRRPERDA